MSKASSTNDCSVSSLKVACLVYWFFSLLLLFPWLFYHRRNGSKLLSIWEDNFKFLCTSWLTPLIRHILHNHIYFHLSILRFGNTIRTVNLSCLSGSLTIFLEENLMLITGNVQALWIFLSKNGIKSQS